MGFDLTGAALDLDLRAKRHAPLWAKPGVADAVRLLYRNPQFAEQVVAFLRSQAGLKELDQPVEWDRP